MIAEPDPLLSPARLAELEFQSEHRGFSSRRVADMQKRGVDVSKLDNGSMIQATPAEMRLLLAAYREKGNG